MTDIPTFVSKSELADLICMAPEEIDTMVATGELPKPVGGMGKWRWSTVDHYLSTAAGERGTVYFVECGAYIKIGYTTDPEGRLASLSGFMPEPVRLLHRFYGRQDDETDLHRKFKHLRVGGEWFRKEAELLDHIEELQNSVRTKKRK